MKSLLTFFFLWILTMNLSYAQKIGLNITNPSAPIHMVQPTGTTLLGAQPLLFSEYTGTNLADAIAIKGKCKPGDYYGIGGDFEGGYVGVQGRITGGLAQNYIGVRGDVAGTGTGDFFGTYGYAHSSGDNYGVYGIASGGISNWAGYFATGNVHIQNRLCIGTTDSANPVHINQPSGLVLNENIPLMKVEYTGTNAENVTAVYGKSASANDYGIGGTFDGGGVGVVGRVIDNIPGGSDHIGVYGYVFGNNSQNMAIYGTAGGTGSTNYAGYFDSGNVYVENRLGLGREPVTNKLEVEGSASKSSAGDWLANSDIRLKKNIKPLDEKQMIEKLLAIKGITYEWNDDKTGSERPEGIQYGFSAQNIQEVFPTLVEEDAKGYLQTAYGTYDAMTVEAIRFLYLENQQLKEEIREIREMIGTASAGK